MVAGVFGLLRTGPGLLLLLPSSRVVALASELAAPGADDSAALRALRPRPASAPRNSATSEPAACSRWGRDSAAEFKRARLPLLPQPKFDGVRCCAAERGGVLQQSPRQLRPGRGGALEGPSRGVKARGGGGRESQASRRPSPRGPALSRSGCRAYRASSLAW